MRLLVVFFISVFSLFPYLEGEETSNIPSDYKKKLLERVGENYPKLAEFPHLKFPNQDYATILPQFPDSKVLIFGYGSLINRASASRNVKPEVIDTMQPAVTFGVKRIFNYQAQKTSHWGENQDKKEKAMLNLVPSMDVTSMINGITMEVDADDLADLITREKGYDLVPLLVASWENVMREDPNPEIKVAYTFISPNEPREHVIYTSSQYYPVRGYLHAIQEGSLDYGQTFADFWDETTYLADGTTKVANWDQTTFKDILSAEQAVKA